MRWDGMGWDGRWNGMGDGMVFEMRFDGMGDGMG